MTMQVGMVGTDGVLIASDTRTTHTPRWVNAGMPRVTFDSAKIKIDHKRGIAVSCARNLETANHLASEIMQNLREEDFQHPIEAIEEMAQRVLTVAKDERNDAQCLVALRYPTPQLFHFQYGEVNGAWGPWCQRMRSKMMAGDNVNPAAFWAERYYKKLPIRQLIPLAAQTIVSAQHLNSGAISGLDIVLCDANGIYRLSERSVETLENTATQKEQTIGEMIFTQKQEFTFAPNAR